jgi:hypothetical protein
VRRGNKSKICVSSIGCCCQKADSPPTYTRRSRNAHFCIYFESLGGYHACNIKYYTAAFVFRAKGRIKSENALARDDWTKGVNTHQSCAVFFIPVRLCAFHHFSENKHALAFKNSALWWLFVSVSARITSVLIYCMCREKRSSLICASKNTVHETNRMRSNVFTFN